MFKTHAAIWLIVGSLLAAGLLVAAVWGWIKWHQPVAPVEPSISQVVVQGQLTCLPKKGDGPQTLECAYGLISEGRYYGLQTDSATGQRLADYTFDDVLKVSGRLSRPADKTIYDIEGTIKVESIELVAGQS